MESKDGFVEALLFKGTIEMANSNGMYVESASTATLYRLESSKDGIKRLNNRDVIRCELGSPKRSSFATFNERYKRIMEIHDDNVAATIEPGSISLTQSEDGVVTVLGKVKPAGPHSIIPTTSNKMCFAMRALTDVKNLNPVFRNIQSIITFDVVANSAAK